MAGMPGNGDFRLPVSDLPSCVRTLIRTAVDPVLGNRPVIVVDIILPASTRVRLRSSLLDYQAQKKAGPLAAARLFRGLQVKEN